MLFRLLTGTLMVGVATLASAEKMEDTRTVEDKITQAVKPLPESMRDGATVVEYDAQGYRTILREGTNSMVCEPDDPSTEGFRVSCYHKYRIARLNFEHQLAATGMDPKEVFKARSAKVDAALLPLPVAGQMSYGLYGDTEAAARPGRSIRVPYATADSTGLPTERDEDEGIWLMQAGTNRAHIMVIGTPSNKPETPPPTGDKVAEAVLAAPKALRAGATVVEYDERGDRHVLRQGTNSLICEPDGPAEGFRVICYHESRVPQYNFERKLQAQGMDRMEVFKKRVAEVEAGRIPLPVAGQISYSLSGDDVATATRRGQTVRMPYATSESTGLPTERGEDGIWLMQESTNRGHIMIRRP